jgi:cell division protein FtsA
MILAGLDVGSHRVTVVAGRQNKDGSLEIVALGAAPSRGIRGGAVVHLGAAAECIEKAIQQAESECGFPLGRIAVGIGDDAIRSFNGRGVVPVMGKDQEVSEADKQRALQAAQTLGIPTDREVIHLLPVSFVLDGQPGIQEPVGMWGVQLEAEVHIVTGLCSVVRNLQKALRRVGYEADRFILSSLAAARSVLHLDEERWGVAVLDIGAQTTGITVISEEVLCDTAVLGVGSDQMTHDLAIGLRTPLNDAEMMKRRNGLVGVVDAVKVATVGEAETRAVSQSTITSILGPRVEEILGLAARQIQRAVPLERLQGGIVLSGGGAEMPGLSDYAQRVLRTPVRVGRPTGLTTPMPEGFDASWSCAVGLLVELATERQVEVARRKDPLLRRVARPLTEFVRTKFAL